MNKTLKLVNNINYQEGSIVSKELICHKKVKIILFAFDKNQDLSEHVSPFDAFIYVIEGDALIQINKKVNKMQKGDMIILPSNHPHSVKALTCFKMLLVMIKKS